MAEIDRASFAEQLARSPEARVLAISMLIEWIDAQELEAFPSLQAEHMMIEFTRDSPDGRLKPTFFINYPALTVDIPVLEEQPAMVAVLQSLSQKIRHLTGIDRIVLNGFRQGKRTGLLFWYAPNSENWLASLET